MTFKLLVQGELCGGLMGRQRAPPGPGPAAVPQSAPDIGAATGTAVLLPGGAERPEVAEEGEEVVVVSARVGVGAGKEISNANLW